MDDVTEIFDHYRLTARDLWNQGFWSPPDLRVLTHADRYFETVRKVLFEVLVLERLAINYPPFRDPTRNWRAHVRLDLVVPSVRGQLLHERLEGGFDVEGEVELGTEMILEFRDYFEWGLLSYVDYALLLVRIRQSVRTRSLTRRLALISSSLVRFYVSDGK